MAQQQQTQAVAVQQQNAAATNTFAADLEAYTPNLADALPPHIPVERFKRVLVTAVSSNPDLLYANRRTLFTAAVKCAADGLIPDGREAALVVYRGTKVKQRDPNTGLDREIRIDAVQYMPMVAGIRKRLRNTGEVASAYAEAVFEKDSFRYRLGDNAFIEHEPPPLGVDRGKVIGAYAIIRLTNGEVIRDVMDRPAIDKARNQGKAPDSLMWKDFYWEGAKKTVLRRASKQAPISADIERLMGRDDEDPISGLHGHELLADRSGGDPEPQREEQKRVGVSAQPAIQEETGPQYAVVDSDGVENVFSDPRRAVSAMELMLSDAATLGLAQLDGLWESNQPVLELLGARGLGEDVGKLAQAYDETRQRLKTPSQQQEQKTAAQPDTQQQQKPAAAEATSTTTAAAGGGQAAPGGAANDGWPGPETAGAAAQTAATNGQAQPGAADAGADQRPESLHIPPVLKGGKPDWRTWTVALFLPKLRRQRDATTLAFLLGDNEENLRQAQAPGALHKDDADELASAIAMQHKAVK